MIVYTFKNLNTVATSDARAEPGCVYSSAVISGSHHTQSNSLLSRCLSAGGDVRMDGWMDGWKPSLTFPQNHGACLSPLEMCCLPW